MERKSVILEVDVQHDGSSHRASYFVEDTIIYASIDGHVLIAPLGQEAAASTVRMLLSGHLRQRSRKLKHARQWRKAPIG